MNSNYIEAIGLIAGMCTTISFVPQVMKVIRSGRARDLSLAMYIIFLCGVFMWLFYGLLLRRFAIIFANTVTIILCLFIIVKIIRTQRNDKG